MINVIDSSDCYHQHVIIQHLPLLNSSTSRLLNFSSPQPGRPYRMAYKYQILVLLKRGSLLETHRRRGIPLRFIIQSIRQINNRLTLYQWPAEV